MTQYMTEKRSAVLMAFATHVRTFHKYDVAALRVAIIELGNQDQWMLAELSSRAKTIIRQYNYSQGRKKHGIPSDVVIDVWVNTAFKLAKAEF